MNSSDLIAITAVIITGIVSALSAYISHQNNKANIVARRSEMVFEKRLDAFSRVVEKIGLINNYLRYDIADYIHKSDRNATEEKNCLRNIGQLIMMR